VSKNGYAAKLGLFTSTSVRNPTLTFDASLLISPSLQLWQYQIWTNVAQLEITTGITGNQSALYLDPLQSGLLVKSAIAPNSPRDSSINKTLLHGLYSSLLDNADYMNHTSSQTTLQSKLSLFRDLHQIRFTRRQDNQSWRFHAWLHQSCRTTFARPEDLQMDRKFFKVRASHNHTAL